MRFFKKEEIPCGERIRNIGESFMEEKNPATAQAKEVTAEDIAKEFKEHSVAEFFKKNKQMLGLTGKIKSLTVIVHEYTSNSLDACEEAKILPDIEISVSELGEEYYEITVKDSGPGLTKDTVGKALGQLLAGTKFHRLIQQRGQQGIGASGVTMLSLITTGKPIQVVSGTSHGKPFACELSIDPKKNEPKIMNYNEIDKGFKGLAIKAKFKEVKYQKGEQSPLEYLRRTAIANPHAQITFTEPDGTKTFFKRTIKQIPARPTEILPHPRGVTVDELLTMAKATKARKTNSFLKTDFDRMGEKAIEDISKKIDFDLNIDPKKIAWEQAEQIVKAFKAIDFISPRTDALRPIGEKQVETSLKAIVQPEFLSVITRKPQVYAGGFPFQVEVAVAYGGNAGKVVGKTEEGTEQRRIEIMRFANKTPLLFDSGGCAITKAVQSIEWKRYGIKDIESAPLTVFLNILSVHIPYTGAGKQAVSDEDEIMEEMRLALMEAGRKIYRFVAGKRREAEKQEKRRLFYKYATEIAIALSALTGKKKEDIEKKLHLVVLRKLKIDELREKEENNDLTDEEIEKKMDKEKKKKAKKEKEEEEEE